MAALGRRSRTKDCAAAAIRELNWSPRFGFDEVFTQLDRRSPGDAVGIADEPEAGIAGRRISLNEPVAMVATGKATVLAGSRQLRTSVSGTA